VNVVVTASEPRGHLHSWSLSAEYGNGEVRSLRGESYPTAPRPASRRWVGVARASVPFVPPMTCAYVFRVGATMRTTNGYVSSGPGDSTFKALTLVQP
jgi:hypothetical protein